VKLSLLKRKGPDVVVSLVSVTSTFAASEAFRQPFGISPCEKRNAPSSGAIFLNAAGAGFLLYVTSMKISVGGTSSPASHWISDSFIRLKTPAGLHSTSATLLIATFEAVAAKGAYDCVEFDLPAVNGSADVFKENSRECVFNSSGCVPGRLIHLVHSTSGFGTSPIPQPMLSLVQGGSPSQACDNTSWISDSSVFCLFSPAFSPEFRSVHVIVGTTGVHLSLRNPFYIPAPPPLTNETVKFRFYTGATFPRGEDDRFREFGTTTGFQWPDSFITDTAQYSEVLTFSVIILINSSQVFLNSQFMPIETNVSVILRVLNESDVTSLVLCDKSSFLNISFTLPPRLFWASAAVTLALCAPKQFNGQQLNLYADASVQNVNGNMTLTSISPGFVVYSSGTPSVNFTKSPSKTLSAATPYDDVLAFSVQVWNRS